MWEVYLFLAGTYLMGAFCGAGFAYRSSSKKIRKLLLQYEADRCAIDEATRKCLGILGVLGEQQNENVNDDISCEVVRLNAKAQKGAERRDA